MRTNELMIGDWVHNETLLFGVPYGEDLQVKNIYNGLINHAYGEGGFIMGYRLNECHPIPITAEILKKNGFIIHPSGTVTCYKYNIITDDGFTLKFLDKEVKPNYVHELQHALRLCGMTELADNFKVE